MRNKKAFTLTEILATLAIIGVIIAIAIPSFSKISDKFKEDYYNSLEATVLTSAKNYYKDHPEERPTGNLYSSAITITGLRNKKYVDGTKVYNSDQDCTGYVVVVKENDVYKYVTCMKCNGNDVIKEQNKEYCENTNLIKTENQTLQENPSEGEQKVDKIVNSSVGLMDDNEGSVEKEELYLPVAKDFSMTDVAAKFIKKELTHTPRISRCDNDGNCISAEVSEELSPVNISHISLAKAGDEYKVFYKNENESDTIDRTVKTLYIASIGGTSEIGAVINELFETDGYSFARFEESDDGKEWSQISCNNPCEISKFSKKQIRAIYEKTGYNGLEFITESYDNPEFVTRYIVTVDSDGGEIVNNTSESWIVAEDKKTATISIVENKKINEIPTDITKEGYTFVEWQLNGTKFDLNTSITGDIDLKAKWEANEYTVTFNANGGSVSPSSKTVTYNSTYGNLPTPTRSGYTFTGWYTQASRGSKITSSTKVTTASNHTLYAHWSENKYSVSCSVTNGTCSQSSKEVTHGGSTTFTISANTGYTTTGATVSGTGCSLSGSTLTVSNVTGARSCTVTLQPKTYTVTFDANGGSVSPSSKTITYNSTYENLPTPTRSGYTFTGWYTQASGGSKITSSSKVTTTSNHTLYARWSLVTYNVSCSAINGSCSPSSKEVGYGSSTTFTISANTGYTTTEAIVSGTGCSLSGSTLTVSNVIGARSCTVTLQPKTYTVTFDANGGSVSPSSKTITYNSTYENLPTPTRSGYTFTGWYTQASGGSKITSSSKVTTTSNHTLYAHWSLVTYNVSCSATNGSCSPSSKEVGYGSSTTFTINANTGYTTTGAIVSGTGCSLSGSTLTVSNVIGARSCSVTLQPKTYTVTFNANGGSVSQSSKTVTYNSTYGTLPTPTRSGYNFTGWYTAASGGSNITSSTKLTTTSNHTLYAHWSEIKYSVSCSVTNGTCSQSSKQITHGGSTTFTISANTGYTTTGATVSGTGCSLSGSTLTVSNVTGARSCSVTLQPRTYTITFDKKDGSGGADVVYEKYGIGLYSDSSATNSISSIEIPYKDGYNFMGYYYDLNGASYRYISSSGGFDANMTNAGKYKAFDSDVVLYAKWEPKIIRITLNQNGGSGGTSAIYQKYGVGLYYDSSATQPLGDTITVPTREGYVFQHYYGYIGSDGSFGSNLTGNNQYKAFIVDTELTAEWEKLPDPEIILHVNDFNLNTVSSTTNSGVCIRAFVKPNGNNIKGINYNVSGAKTESGIQTNSESQTADQLEAWGVDGTYDSYWLAGCYTTNGTYNIEATLNYNNTSMTTTKTVKFNNLLPLVELHVNDWNHNTISSATNSAVCIRAFVNPNGQEINRIDYSVTGAVDESGMQTNSESQTAAQLEAWGVNSSYNSYWLAGCFQTNGTYTINATVIYSGGAVNADTLTVKYDNIKPTISLDMRALGYYTTNTSSYTAEPVYTYSSSTPHYGYVYLTLNATDSSTGIKSKKCTVTGADVDRTPGVTSFSTYRHIMESGQTTISCTATDGAGNSSSLTKYVNLGGAHTHEFGSRCISNSCSNNTIMKASTYWTTYYSSYNPSYYDWTCTAGHNHRTYNSNNFYVRTCSVCKKNARVINMEEGTNYATWWCPGSSSQLR